MSYIKGLKVFILLTSVIYQIWIMSTVSLMLLYDNLNYVLLSFIKVYVKCISR